MLSAWEGEMEVEGRRSFGCRKCGRLWMSQTVDAEPAVKKPCPRCGASGDDVVELGPGQASHAAEAPGKRKRGH